MFIGVAWPYANGSLHLGHAAGSLLPADIFARYHRLRGRRVLMVSGSDEHGTPITVTAEARGLSPADVADAFHREHVETLERLGIKFELFFRTSDQRHKEVVWEVFKSLLDKGHIYKKEVMALYCSRCGRFLPDRYVEGGCPRCGAEGARGDQCESCGQTLDPSELVGPRCKLCGSAPESRATEHFFLRLSALQPELEEYLRDKGFWRPNTIKFTRNWLSEGLKDRAITRDLTWGVEIPLQGYEGKRIYVWFEAVTGYLSASKEWARRRGEPEGWREFWQDPAARHYYFIGKDNVPFHTIIWPGILIGVGGLNLPYNVPANEFLSFAGEKFSKSRGIGVELPAYLARFDPDPMRYYLTINMPELHDTDFSWEEFVRKNNDELVGTLGNFINRVLTFTFKHFQRVPEPGEAGELDRELFRHIESAYRAVERHIEACEFKSALKELMGLAQLGNRYIDARAPWRLIREDKTRCGEALHSCLRLAKALCVLMVPFMPFSARRLWRMLGEEGDVESARWEDGRAELPEERRLPKPEPLFRKLELDEVLGGPAAVGTAGKGGAPSAEPPGPGGPGAEALDSGEWFDRAELRIGRVARVEPHPSADKLYICDVDMGAEARRIVAGMRQHYSESELAGRAVAVVTNLEPARLRGVESQGMILAFDEGGGRRIALVVPAGEGAPGERVRAVGRTTAEATRSFSIKEFERIDMRAGTVLSVDSGRARVDVGGRAVEAAWTVGETAHEESLGAGEGAAGGGARRGGGMGTLLRPGLRVAVLLASPPALLATERGSPLTAEREIKDGSRVR